MTDAQYDKATELKKEANEPREAKQVVIKIVRDPETIRIMLSNIDERIVAIQKQILEL